MLFLCLLTVLGLAQADPSSLCGGDCPAGWRAVEDVCIMFAGWEEDSARQVCRGLEAEYSEFFLSRSDSDSASRHSLPVCLLSRDTPSQDLLPTRPVAVLAPLSQSLTLPTNEAIIDGSSSSDDRPLTNYRWELLSSPVGYQAQLEQGPTITLTNLTAGNYTVKMTVTDEDEVSASAEATIEVFETTAEAEPDQELSPRGLIITGGGPSDSARQSVEVYVPSTGQHCQLPSLPDKRRGHTMEKRTIYGGGYGDTEKSILTLTRSGTWENTTTTLLESRYYHSSWASPAGVILMGGKFSPKTTERILQNGSAIESFRLKHSTYRACSINMGSSVIITGGGYTPTTVTEYNMDGLMSSDLPDLLQGRWAHGCSRYDNNDGTQTMLVTGGRSVSGDFLSSTELLVGTASAWVPAAGLPSTRLGLRGINIDNRVLMTGGRDGPTYDEILEYEPPTDPANSRTGQWKLKGRMKTARRSHAVSVINYSEVAQFCKSEI